MKPSGEQGSAGLGGSLAVSHRAVWAQGKGREAGGLWGPCGWRFGGEAGRKEVSVAVAARAVAGAPVSLFLHFHTEEERRL